MTAIRQATSRPPTCCHRSRRRFRSPTERYELRVLARVGYRGFRTRWPGTLSHSGTTRRERRYNPKYG
jgi:hypothetical protein